jgi:hypothetical protein
MQELTDIISGKSVDIKWSEYLANFVAEGTVTSRIVYWTARDEEEDSIYVFLESQNNWNLLENFRHLNEMRTKSKGKIIYTPMFGRIGLKMRIGNMELIRFGPTRTGSKRTFGNNVSYSIGAGAEVGKEGPKGGIQGGVSWGNHESYSIDEILITNNSTDKYYEVFADLDYYSTGSPRVPNVSFKSVGIWRGKLSAIGMSTFLEAEIFGSLDKEMTQTMSPNKPMSKSMERTLTQMLKRKASKIEIDLS